MRNLLSGDGIALLERLVQDRTLVAFDFDGTLAPITPQRQDARMRDRTRASLGVAALLLPCAVVSGRSRADVAARVDRVRLVSIVGNHGAEGTRALEPAATMRARVNAWAAALEETLSPELADVENKGFGLAIHYRRARSPEEARRRIFAAARSLPGARAFGGIAVVNVVPAGAPTKAHAVEALAKETNAGHVVYVGDDETDEDAFRSPVVTLGVRVGHAPRSAAPWFVRDQPAVDDLLDALIAARLKARGEGGGRDEVVSPHRSGDPE